MERHFHEELKELKQMIQKMSRLVESAIERSVDALLTRDSSLAKQVLEEERIINQMEIEIDDKGHSLSALWQPVAADLRLIAMILKINTDLERMGDHAVNIAEKTLLLTGEPQLETRFHFREMANAVLEMLKDSLAAFVNEDVELARSVLKRDDEVDAYNDTI